MSPPQWWGMAAIQTNVFSLFPCPCRINMSMPGLPPLPKSLSGFELAAVQQQLQYGLTAITEQAAAAAAAQQQQLQGANHHHHHHQPLQHPQSSLDGGGMAPQPSVSPLPRKSSTLDTQLSILRREMVRSLFYVWFPLLCCLLEWRVLMGLISRARGQLE